MKTTLKATTALTLATCLFGCVEPITQSGESPFVDSVEAARAITPLEASAPYAQVAIDYVLCDEDRDDVSVRFEVCTSETSCLVPVQGFGSDGTRSLPTLPCDEGGSRHTFTWDVCRGAVDLDSDALVAPDVAASYTFNLTTSAGSVSSEAFTLTALGFTEGLPSCDPDGGV